MFISLKLSLTSGFRKWADVYQPIGDEPAKTSPPSAPPAELVRPGRPWLIPGVGTAF